MNTNISLCAAILLLLLFSCKKDDLTPIPVAALDSQPDFIKVLGGPKDDMATSITASPDNGFVVTGITYSNSEDFNASHGAADGWVVKFDKNGNKVWQKQLGGPEFDYLYSIKATLDGGYILAGETRDTDGFISKNLGSVDAWVVKLDGNGNQVWEKKFGGLNSYRANSILTTNDGDFVVTGLTYINNGDLSGNHGSSDAWVMKLDGNGNRIWEKSLGGSSADIGRSITASEDGGYVIVGQTASNNGDVSGNHGSLDIWIIKMDRNGNKLWQKTLGGSGVDNASFIMTALNGDYLVAGETESNDGDVTGNHGTADAWVVRLDKHGKKIWQQTFGGTNLDAAYAIETSGYETYVIVGVTNSNSAGAKGKHGGYEAWAVQFEKNGRKLWQKNLGGSGDNYFSGIIKFGDDHIGVGSGNSNDGDIICKHGTYDAWLVTLKN